VAGRFSSQQISNVVDGVLRDAGEGGAEIKRWINPVELSGSDQDEKTSARSPSESDPKNR
jgi:hypothetical protein